MALVERRLSAREDMAIARRLILAGASILMLLGSALVGATAADTSSFFEPSPNVLPAKKVFAHYMLCCGSFGDTVDAYARDIRMAQAMGLDGFALNAGSWDANYRGSAARMFQAAAELKSGFRLFFSADMCCDLTAGDIVDMVRTYGRHPNYLARDNRPVLSPYASDREPLRFWRGKILAPLRAAGFDVFFVPASYPVTASGLPADEVAHWRSIADGIFFFEPAVTPFGAASSVATNEAYARAAAAHGKLFMAGCYPFYWGSEQPTAGRRYYEYRGGLGTETQWQSIITVQDPEWVEIVTWNDFAESYLIAPAKDPDHFYKPHLAFWELSKYYIHWFKSGVRPKLIKDSLFYFYRTHSKTLEAPHDPLGPVTRLFGNVQDAIYLTVALTAPAELRIASGDMRHQYNVEAGIHHLSVPFAAGDQQFELWRNGTRLSVLQGEPIASSITRYNFFYTTGFVETAP
jgi:glucan endo-1,3-alpha-glucosidase